MVQRHRQWGSAAAWLLCAGLAFACGTSRVPGAAGADAVAVDVSAEDMDTDTAAGTDAAADLAQDGLVDSVDVAVVDAAVGEVGADASLPDASMPDQSADQGSADQVADDGVAPVDATATDVGPDTAIEPDTTGDGCPYKCNIKCLCKKDKQGCDIPECESGTCMTLLGQINQLKPALQACKPEVGCQSFEFPICGSAGCFQLPVSSAADVSALGGLAVQAMEAKCSQFTCGCGPAEPAFCLGGQCRQCPPDCDGTCEEKSAAILKLANSLAWCSDDSQCTVLSTGLCPFAGLPCGGMPVNKFVKTEQLQALLAAYAVPCNVAMCKCAVPGPAVCSAGKCVVKVP